MSRSDPESGAWSKSGSHLMAQMALRKRHNGATGIPEDSESGQTADINPGKAVTSISKYFQLPPALNHVTRAQPYLITEYLRMLATDNTTWFGGIDPILVS
ncbi:hypothetical protein B0H13DRAFT_1925545 [Mycena leptocephala]|nr:hypothetical protein B0H13DRAFT_1925545 [Mycena leptocephala]